MARMERIQRKRLGELLVDTGLLTEAQLERCLVEQRAKRARLGDVIVRLGLATDREIAQALSLQLGIPVVDLQQAVVEPEAIELISEKVARKHLIVPVSIDRKELHLAMADPLSLEALEDVRFASGYTIKPFVASHSDILWAIDQHYHLGSSLDAIVQDIASERLVEVVRDGVETEVRGDLDDLRRQSEAAPVIRMVNLIIAEAVQQGASDVHIEPTRAALRIRNRVDGLLRQSMELPKWVQGAVISRVKIMAKMDIAEKRLPQDGRVGVKVQGRTLDLRVSTIPASHGEKVVLRILDSANTQIALDGMGLSPGELEQMLRMSSRPQGVLLITGPTGSGKTTTLYSILKHLRTIEENITTIEDPVEYELEGINQVATQDKIGLTFPSMLRAILRQDPDIIMVGEMRDLETASIGLQAALTGHLVLSTIHTNDCAATVTRLRHLGIPSYLIATATIGVVAQRLVRAICSRCRVRAELSEQDGLRLRLAPGTPVYRGEGCPACGGSGYKGRTGLFEIMEFTPSIRELIAANATETEIRQAAIARGMSTLGQVALEKVRAGTTTVEEVCRSVETEGERVSACVRCAAPIEAEFVVCPECGVAVTTSCPSCRRMLSAEWKFCPYCRQDVQARRETEA